MAKLGFTFYPKDWWTSDTFFELDSEERYIYLECIFFMYQNNGYLNLDKPKLETRLRTKIKPKVWQKITQLLTYTDLGYTHNSVKKRGKKADTSRENGKLGGRPPIIKEPNNPTINLPLEYKENIIESKEKVIPDFIDFKIYALEKKPLVDLEALNLKYQSWVEGGWKNGNGKKIVNWKSTLLNTLPYIKENKTKDFKIR